MSGRAPTGRARFAFGELARGDALAHPLPCGTVRMIIVAAVVLVVAAGGAAYWMFGRDGGEDVAAFFTLPTPTTCESGALAVTASNAHFAAFSEGRVLAETGDKFLIAEIAVRNDGSAPVAVSEGSFYLAERPGVKRQAAALKDGAQPLSENLEPGKSASRTLAFSVPPSVGAAKLVFDDSCTHQEWLVP